MIENEYDYSLDVFTMTVCDDFNFGKSIELDNGVILDFDENNIPVSIEILDISQRLGITKEEIKNSTTSIQITSNEDVLKIHIKFTINKEFNFKVANNYNIPSMELEMV